jgi:hypothetical protein
VKFTFSHPALAKGVHPSIGNVRTFVGMVDTPITIQEVPRAAAVPAFTVNPGQREMVEIDGLLYHRSPQKLDTLVGRGLANMAHLLEDSSYQMRPITKLISDAISAVDNRSPISPMPGHGVRKSVKWSIAEEVVAWAEKQRPLSKRKALALDEEDIDHWRENVRRFFSHFVSVDGTLFVRCHEPLIIASRHGLHLGSYAFFRSYVDYSNRSSLGFPIGTGSWATDMFPFPADMYDEARAFVSGNGWKDSLHMDEATITVHGQCTGLSEVLDEELMRCAGLCVAVAMTHGYINGDSPQDDAAIALSNAAENINVAAADYRANTDIGLDGLEAAVEGFQSAGDELVSGTQKHDWFVPVSQTVRIMLDRRAAAPIVAPTFQFTG